MLVFQSCLFVSHDATRPDVAADQGWLTGQGILEGNAMCALLIDQILGDHTVSKQMCHAATCQPILVPEAAKND